MESGNNFPWEVLKAECLRVVCHQVCASSEAEAGGFTNSFRKRDEMISFLRDVTERGLDDALAALGESKQTQKETTSGVKRRATDEDIEEEDQDADDVASIAEAPTAPNPHQAYNTRFKGVKRVKLGREVPEGFPYTPHRRAPRKSAPAELASGSKTKTTDKNGADGGKTDSLKRPRGRPRKNPQIVGAHSSAVPVPVTPKAGRPPTSTMKQVFDGVVVVKRTHPLSKRAELEDTAASHPDPDVDADADAEGDMDGDSEEIIAPDHVEVNGLIAMAGENDHSNSNQGDSSVP